MCRYDVIETRKDGTKFTNKALRRAAERLNATSGQYLELQAELVAQVRRVGCGCGCAPGVAQSSVRTWS